MNTHRLLLLTLAATVAMAASREVGACPFCGGVSQTLSQEIDGFDVSVIVRLVKVAPEPDFESEGPLELDLDNLDSGTAEFEVVEVLRGENAPAVGSRIDVVYFGSNEQQKSFLLNGIDGKKIDWNSPLPLTERGINYVKSLGSLPEKGGDRLAFFLNHLEDEDPLLAQDAYDEFGQAPYEDVIDVGDRMDRRQLLVWIEDPQVGPTRRRLYLTMLGICGKPDDVGILRRLLLYDYQQMKPGMAASLAMMANGGPAVAAPVLNEMVKADVRRKQMCLDALIAAYLKLKGPEGLPLVEQKFLANPVAEYTQVYAAVMALRFHGEETDDIPRDRLLESVRLLLDNEEIADQVIPDLARWEDWSVLDKLVTMFKASETDSWVRQPVVSYLLVASEQEGEVAEQANMALAELETLDPESVKRARRYMAFGLLARAGSKKRSARGDNPYELEPQTAERETPAIAQKASAPGADAQATADAADKPADAEATVEAAPVTTAATPAPATPASAAVESEQSVSRAMIVGAPVIAGLFLFGVFALILRGADVRSTASDS